MTNQPAPAPFIVLSREHHAGIIALLAALSHLVLLLLIQLENFFSSIWPASHSFSALLLFAAGFGFAQWENIVVAALLGALTLVLAPTRAGRWLSFSIVCLINLYLVLDQVGFKLFFDHFAPSMLEGGQRLGALRSSIAAELDGTFIFNIFILILISLFLGFLFFNESALRRMPLAAAMSGMHRSPKVLGIALVLIVIGFLFPVQAKYAKLYQHPFHNLVASLNTPPQKPDADASPRPVAAAAATANSTEPLDLLHLHYGTAPTDPTSDARLDEALIAAQARKSHWNIIWIVMESVGSKQMLTTDGLPDPTITPNLSRLAQHAAVFNSLYSVFPGTVRSHVDMATGGRTITWGSVFEEFTHPYEGPTTVSALNGAGYGTALFSAQRLDFENMNSFYKQEGFEHYYDFGDADPEFQKQNTLQSWGAKEGPILSLAVKWIDQQRERNRPFFLKYLTVATHHPYDVPSDFHGPASGTTRESNYKNALNYTDSALGVFLKQLESRHLLDNTLIVINGDHGEAFGEYHAQNFLHKNYLYEENVKNFLLIANPMLFPDTVVSPRIASIGDIMPTILGLNDTPPGDVPGQNLMSKAYTPRIVYFYKNTEPESWGLRDGQWKFIDAKLGGYAELYDLSVDPNEANNVAQIYPDRVAYYNRLASRWYAQTNHDFVSRLKGFEYPGGKEMTEADIRTPGPKLLAFGYRKTTETTDRENFQEVKALNPFEEVVAWTRWVNYPRDKSIHYAWKSPNGEVYQYDFNVKSIWATTVVRNTAPLPLEEGTWQLSLQDGDQTLITGSFVVDHNAPLHIKRDEAQALEIATGRYVITNLGKEEFKRTASVKPGDHIAVWTLWKRLDHDRRIVYKWRSPSGQMTEFYFDVKKGWNQTIVNLGNEKPAEVGRWEVTLWDGDRKLTSTKFDVAVAGP